MAGQKARSAVFTSQSIASAVCLGAFLTLFFYLLIPHLVTHSGRQTSDIIVSALLGGTIVHSAIVFLFFVIVAAILDAVQLHARDRAILASFGREIDDDRKVGAKRGLSSILSDELGSAIHTRAFRLLNAAIESKTGDKPPNLAALAFDGFQAASRQFVRALLPFLPLLGFLGTVIGLATAISELPRGLTEGSGQAFDISASLSGLAVKFETTLLGLMASMISSLCLHFLEKREAELAAACMLLVRGPVSAMLDAFARARSIIVAPQLGGEDAHITDPLADLLLSVAAIIVLVVIAVLPTIPRHPFRVPIGQASLKTGVFALKIARSIRSLPPETACWSRDHRRSFRSSGYSWMTVLSRHSNECAAPMRLSLFLLSRMGTRLRSNLRSLRAVTAREACVRSGSIQTAISSPQVASAGIAATCSVRPEADCREFSAADHFRNHRYLREYFCGAHSHSDRHSRGPRTGTSSGCHAARSRPRDRRGKCRARTARQ